MDRIVLSTIVMLVTAMCTAQNVMSDFCDPALEIQNENPYRYQERLEPLNSQRCEGLFLQNVSSSVIRLTSLTKTYEAFSVDPGIVLTLSWSEQELQQKEPLHIRAEGQAYKTYYRMDTEIDLSRRRFTWPTDVLGTLELDKSEVGISAWLPLNIGGTERDVYIPLDVTQKEKPALESTYRVVIVPLTELAEVRYRIAKEIDGYPGDTVVEKELGYGYYFNGRPIEFDIDFHDQDAGFYYLEIEAEREDDNNSRLELWFHHAGN